VLSSHQPRDRKDAEYAWDRPQVTTALSAEQREILEKRGVLSPEEIHRQAHKTRHAMAVERGEKATCHSDVTVAENAKRLQEESLEPSEPQPRA
jgi:phosphomethylpyrimidine synthase